jgi:uncharacterized protein YecT (DUF1311 family)
MGCASRFTAPALALVVGFSLSSSGLASERSAASARRAALEVEMGNDLAHSERYARSSSAEFDKCIDRSQGVTSEMRDCSNVEEMRQDHLLNEAYRLKMARLSSPRRAALQASERTWVKRRKAFCDSYVTRDGGTAQLLFMDSCYMNTTIHRTLFIQRFK